jgi:hypothetical protein
MSKRQKGKIARGEWEKITRRYEAGESLASIARDYGCTAPAIRYIVTRPTGEQSRPAAQEAAPGVSSAPAVLARIPMRAARTMPTALIDSELRSRVTNDVARLLVAFENATGSHSPEPLEELRGAVDRLLRSASRVLIEIERHAELRDQEKGARSEAATGRRM